MSHLSTLTLHRYRYQELDPRARADAASHLEGCSRCRARLGVQERTRAELVVQPVPEAIRQAAEVEARQARRAPGWGWLRQLIPVAAMAAAALTFVAVPALRDVDGRPELVDTVRTKGSGDTLEIWVQRPGGARVLRPDEALKAGDTIQILFHPLGASHVTLVGRDPTGEVEIWRTLEPERDALQPAPFALTLDDTPGYQEVIVVGSEMALTDAEIRAAVAGRRVPNVARVESVLLPKE